MSSSLSSYNAQLNGFLAPLDTPIGSGLVKLLLVLYASTIAPKLPNQILAWFDYVPFKILFLSLIVWSANHDPALAILIAAAFYASLNVFQGKKAFEKFRSAQF